MDEQGYFAISADEVRAWIVDGEIHIRAVARGGDPVELTPHEARLLAEALLRLVALAEESERR